MEAFTLFSIVNGPFLILLTDSLHLLYSEPYNRNINLSHSSPLAHWLHLSYKKIKSPTTGQD